MSCLVSSESPLLVKPCMVFLEGDAGSLHLPAPDAQTLRRYMVPQLQRQPGNLRRHVQYILTLRDSAGADPQDLFAALLDLFIALGAGGLPLRRRMLAIARPLLAESDHDFLRRHLQSGLTAATPLPPGTRSALSKGVTGHTGFVRKLDVGSKAQGFASQYEEALSLLEYGEVEEAQGLFEQALRLQPDDERIAGELLGIYAHRNDAQSLAGMSQWFMDNSLPLPQCWPLL